ncbi:MAG: RNA polymerase sigma factor [Candidatus Nealsonbacteria bacterium]|nr:RNA polymerase sigma factor [Candidatus Nealsonbacteria bacterium]
MKKTTESQFIESYDSYADSLFRHCYLRVFDRDLSRDLVQEAFIRVWNYLAEGKEIRNFKPFLYQVVDNLIIDNSRKRKTVSLDLLQERGVEPRLDVEAGRFEKLIDAKRASEIIVQLEEPYRQVLLLRYLDDLSVKEIAKICGETENNISVRIHRGLKKLNEILDHEPKS